MTVVGREDLSDRRIAIEARFSFGVADEGLFEPAVSQRGVRVRNRTRHPRIRERRHSGEQHNGHGGGTERSERSHHDD